jgi:chromosome segregation ATPase
MIDWIFGNAQTVVALLELGVIAIGGFFIFTGAIGGKAKEIHGESDNIQQTLINNYRTLIDDQNKRIADLSAKEIAAGREISHLQGQVKTLEAILQGKDPAMQDFLKAAPRLLEVAEENNQLGRTTNASVAKLADAVTELVHTLSEGSRLAPQLVID